MLLLSFVTSVASGVGEGRERGSGPLSTTTALGQTAASSCQIVVLYTCTHQSWMQCAPSSRCKPLHAGAQHDSVCDRHSFGRQ